MNILQVYRKFAEKSRRIVRGISGHDTRLDRILFFAALAVCAVIIIVNLSARPVGSPKRTELFIPPQCEEMFGRETIGTLIREFEEQHPELRIRIEEQAAADLIFFDEGNFSALMREGRLSSLASYIRTESGSGQRAIPLVSFMDLFVYNIDILKAAGFDRPPRTRSEFLACARAAGGMDGVYGFALGLSPGDPLALRRDVFSWIWAAGGEVRPPEWAGGRPEVSRTAEDIIAFFGQLNREGLLAPGTFDKTGTERAEDFSQGNIAMMTVSARDLPLLKKRMGAAFGLTVIPAAAAPGKTRLGLSGIYAGISGECARPDEAWVFLAFLAEKGPYLSAALQAVPGPGSFPGVTSFPAGYITKDSLYAKAWDIFEAADIVEGFSGQPHEEELNRVIREKLSAGL